MAERRITVCDVCDNELAPKARAVVVNVAVRRKNGAGLSAPHRLDVHPACLAELDLEELVSEVNARELELEPEAQAIPVGEPVDGSELVADGATVDPLAPPADPPADPSVPTV